MPAINWKRIRKEQVQKRITNSGFDFHTCKKILDKFIRISRWLRTLQNFTKQYTNGASQQLEGTSNLSINFVLTNDCKLSRKKLSLYSLALCNRHSRWGRWHRRRICHIFMAKAATVTIGASALQKVTANGPVGRANTRCDLNHSVTYRWSSKNKWTVFKDLWRSSSTSFLRRMFMHFNHPELKVPTNKEVYRHISH